MVKLQFTLSQHSRDEQLMRSLIKYLDCGDVYKDKDRDSLNFRVVKLSDLNEKIIPFFKQYPILGVKVKDFEDLCEVAEMMKNKEHLTPEGLEQIEKIKVRVIE